MTLYHELHQVEHRLGRDAIRVFSAAGFGGVDSASEAFDEPLTAGQVTAILANFLP